MIGRLTHRVAALATGAAVLAAAGCSSAPSGAVSARTTSGAAGVPVTAAPGGGPAIAGGSSHCENPSTVQDLTLGAYLAIEATAVPSGATAVGAGVSIPLTDVTILWQAVPGNVPPRAVEAGNVSVDDADLFLPAGRYVLLLGSGRAGHWYPAMGRQGQFAYVDARGSELTQFCTAYTATPGPPVTAPGSISRTTLLALLEEAPLPDPRYSPRP